MLGMLKITEHLQIPDSEYSVTAVRSQGAGGQNVNKVASAVQLRFDIPASSLPEDVKKRLLNLDDQRVSQEGVLIIKAQEFRSQSRNLNAAKDRLITFVHRGLRSRKKRLATKPGKAAVQRRLDSKHRRGQLKTQRRKQAEE